MSSSEQHMVIDEASLMAYINGELTTSQVKSVQNWLKASEKHRLDFEQLRKTWEASGQLDPNLLL
jgi:ferric-dicitrate binding protein FerR (iron transport regulator)